MKKCIVYGESQADADILHICHLVFYDGAAGNAPSLSVSPFSDLPLTRVYVAGARKLQEVIKHYNITGRNKRDPT